MSEVAEVADRGTGVLPVAPDAVVRAVYRAFGLRDLSRLGGLLTDDVEWIDPVPSDGGLHLVGREAALSWLVDLIGASRGTFALRLQRVYTDGASHAVAFHEVTTSDGRVRTRCLLFAVRDGLVGGVLGLAPAPSGPLA